MPKPSENPRNGKHVVLILGMHRSGTSAVARALSVFGVDLGDKLMPGAEGNNRKGFFEDEDVIALNDAILRRLGAKWSSRTPLDPKWFDGCGKWPEFTQATNLLRQRLSGVDCYGTKDPRIALLLPFWSEVFDRLSLSIHTIVACRNPLSVAASLAKRDLIPTDWSLLLWEKYNLDALGWLAEHDGVVVDFDQLMENPRAQLGRMAAYMEEFSELSAAGADLYVDEFLEQGLRHHVIAPIELERTVVVADHVKNLYRILIELSLDRTESTKIGDKLQAIAADYQEAMSGNQHDYDGDSYQASVEQSLYYSKMRRTEEEKAGRLFFPLLNSAALEPKPGSDKYLSVFKQLLSEQQFYLGLLSEKTAHWSERHAESEGRRFEVEHQLTQIQQALRQVENTLEGARIESAQRAQLIEDLKSKLLNQDKDWKLEYGASEKKRLQQEIEIQSLRNAVNDLEAQILKNKTLQEQIDAQNKTLQTAEQASVLQKEKLDQALFEAKGFKQRADQLDQELIHTQKELEAIQEQSEQRFSETWGALAEKENELADVKDQSAEQLSEAWRTLGEKESIVRLLSEQIQQQNLTIASLYSSFSWKVTAPLRAGASALRLKPKPGKAPASLPMSHLSATKKESNDHKTYEKASKCALTTYTSPIAKKTHRIPAPPVRLIAFYLPQFHEIEENNRWWGKGFTEWTNVKSALPQFSGHDQPRIPYDDDYYDLSDPAVMERQIQLAHSYGLHGFCFYFYWFSGRRVLEKPLLNLLERQEIDLPFCLCWANENWTRRWDGREKDILLAQTYTEQDDIEFISYVTKYFNDKRYIRVGGKPLLVIYRPNLFPSIKATAYRWRSWCRENEIGEIYLAATTSFEEIDPRKIGFDAVLEFPPNNTGPDRRKVDANSQFKGDVFSMASIAERARDYTRPSYPLFRGVCPAWDNTPRRKNKATIFIEDSPGVFAEWVCNAACDTIDRLDYHDERLVFVNAWNEWAEGAYLEPDAKKGYAYLEALANALERVVVPRKRLKLALIAHIYFIDLVDEMASYIRNMPPGSEILITTPYNLVNQVERSMEYKLPGYIVTVEGVENRGRDILPFLGPFVQRYERYDLICKIHSKKSLHAQGIDNWRRYLFETLLGSPEVVVDHLDRFQQDATLGLIYPDYTESIKPWIEWGSNKNQALWLLNELNCHFDESVQLDFPAGSMFWFRPQALKTLCKYGFGAADFPPEEGQIDGTLQHAIERSFLYVLRSRGFSDLRL